jgi:two-component system, LytTR family, sensor histidine kinase AlgZ
MASIREKKQSLRALRLPDFSNLGTWLRVLLFVNGAAVVAALMRNREFARVPAEFTAMAAYVEPITLAAMLLLSIGRRWLAGLPGLVGGAIVVGIVAATAAFCGALLDSLDPDPVAGGQRVWLWAALAAIGLLAWFDLGIRARSPAVTEAKMMALTARIRPHFLFNSLNAVLGVIRSDPRRAEAALEELADLFRVLMRDNRELVPLSAEIGLARQYLELERLRLGDRLLVRWDVDSCPPDALVPPLMLQPLLENAVYHGIEPLPGAGEIGIRLDGRDDHIVIELTNPCPAGGHQGAGSHMALANIRERLLLFFDLEATLDTGMVDGRYRVTIKLPYRRKEFA